MAHVVVAGSTHDSGLALLRARPDVTFDYVPEMTEAAYLPFVERADALVIRTQPLTAATIARAGRLRIVSRHGVGYDSVDVAALDARGIPLTIVGDVNSVSVAEQAMMLLLAAAKRAVRADRAVREGGWGWRERLEQAEIGGRRLLVVGYGRSGRRLARMAAGFDMEVRAFSPSLLERGWPDGPVRPVPSLAEGLAWADFVSIHAPGTGRPLIGAAELAAMRPGGILVNTARGGLVDEAALVESLRSSHLAAAGLDVFGEEPPGPGYPLLALDQVVLSPHIAGVTSASAERMAVASVGNVLDFLDGRLDPAMVVNAGAVPPAA